jgi:hypothetical protein
MEFVMRELELNDLPKWSKWPARLLGTEHFAEVKRDHAKIHSEYSVDKWQKCSDILDKSGARATAHDLRMNYHEFTSGDERPCLLNGKLYLAKISEIMPIYDELIVSAVQPSLSSTGQLVELGCGPGFIMSMLSTRFPQARFIGGDFAESAVALAKRLYPMPEKISVSKFDFYADNFELLEKLSGGATIFTCQALEQIPDCRKTIETLSKYRDKIDRVVHLEPGYDLYDNSLLGHMRKRYIQINDYNRNLFSTLQGRKDVEVLRCEENVIGWNPFNALMRLEWKFKN